MSFWTGMMAAILAPLMTTIGFHIWEYYWSSVYSAFALNLYKCCFASILFLITIYILSVTTYSDTNTLFWSFPNDTNNGTDINNNNNNNEDYDNEPDHTKQQIVGYLLLSSVIGIIIGDILWLYALSILGSVRVIFMDALKPFCATIFGILFLNESFYYPILIGIIITVIGIVCISLDRNKQNHSSTASSSSSSFNIYIGYGMSLSNVLLDTYGTVLTKEYGITISIWEINLIRFGFAACVLTCISILCICGTKIYHHLNLNTTISKCKNDIHSRNNITDCIVPATTTATTATTKTKQTCIDHVNALDMETTDIVKVAANMGECIDDKCHENNNSANSFNQNNTEPPNVDHELLPEHHNINKKETDTNNSTKIEAIPWYVVPICNKHMSIYVWIYISIGVIFVTYISPTLYNYALFELSSIALLLTLSSIGPFYAIPISYMIQLYLYYQYKKDYSTNDDVNLSCPSTNDDNNNDMYRSSPKKPTIQAWLGATMTVGGIVLLAYTGGSAD